MSRVRRLKLSDDVAYYHIMSRTAGQLFLFDKAEKDTLTRIMHYFAGMYFVKAITFCVMGNHFHLLLKTEPERMYSDEEVVRRIREFVLRKSESRIIRNRDITTGDIAAARKKFADISEYCKAVKQTFSIWYNKVHNRTGYLWGDRFKSVLLEEGDSVLRCAAYIELNPVRAGLVEKPESYRWCGLHHRLFGGRGKYSLTFHGIFASDERQRKTPEYLLRNYRAIVHHFGQIEDGDEVSLAVSRLPRLPSGRLLLGRIRHFTDGAVIGSTDFLLRIYAAFGGTVIRKKDRNLYPTGISPNLFSIRNVRMRN